MIIEEKIYYINEITTLSDYDKTYIGLFTDTNWSGEGDFCGWYGAEFYNNTTLLAYYIIENPHIYKPRGSKHLDEKICNEYYNKIGIGSGFWTLPLKAISDEEAIQKFFNEDY